MQDYKFDRRDFLKAGGVSALGTQMAFAGSPALAQESAPSTSPHEKGFPQLAIITHYSPQKLAFAASAEYQGVVITVDRFFNPDTVGLANRSDSYCSAAGTSPYHQFRVHGS